ncbi:MAG: phosphate--acyl-ACP acyltransferase [Spirochaetaceae bacterium]|nr:phosphate--acyl-ACP acyltransferase [Spirochaetaceae bacterium]
MSVAVDTMSGDLGPEPAVSGALAAVREYGARVILVGDPDKLESLLEKQSYDRDMVEIEEANDIIGMSDSPSQSVRTRKDSSVVVAARLVREQKAIGFFSPGNTGATMAAALMEMGRIRGVSRPCIASPIPREDGGTTILVDSGANVDAKPQWMVQFAIMGELYAREILGVESPKIALLSNGEEEKKGNALSISAYQRLAKLPYDFIGNIEGRDIYGGTPRKADVVVCDGFMGNVLLKATEGLAGSIFTILLRGIAGSSLARTGAYLLKPVLEEIKRRMDYTEYGGAPLLGVNGACVIGHGNSNAKAFKNAVRLVWEYSEKEMNHKIETLVRKHA